MLSPIADLIGGHTIYPLVQQTKISSDAYILSYYLLAISLAPEISWLSVPLLFIMIILALPIGICLSIIYYYIYYAGG